MTELVPVLNELGRELKGLTKAIRENKSADGTTKTDLAEMERRIMSKITEWADREEANLAEIQSTLNSISSGVDNLKKMITDFQNSPGTLSPDDQARLDKIQAASNALSEQAKAIKVDAPTPPTP